MEEERKNRREKGLERKKCINTGNGRRRIRRRKEVPFSLHSVIRSSSLNLAGASTSFLPLSLLL